jgi:predicted membrane protein
MNDDTTNPEYRHQIEGSEPYSDFDPYAESEVPNAAPPDSFSRMMPNDYPSAPSVPASERRTRVPTYVKLIGGCLAASMIVFLVLACIGGVATAMIFSSPEVSASSSQDLSVSSMPLLNLNSNATDVTILAGADHSTVHILVEKHAQAINNSSAQDALNRMKVTTTQSGDTIHVETQFSDETGIILHHEWMDLTITVPPSTNLDLTTGAGDVTITGVTGTMHLTSNAGNIALNNAALEGTSTIHSEAGDMKFQSVITDAHTSIITSAGNVDFNGAVESGASLSVHTNAGNISLLLPPDTSAHFSATSNVGNITIDPTWPISVTKESVISSANGTMGTSPRATISVTTNAGDITVSPS